MSVVFNAATAANVSILRTTNELFQTSQKRVATGKSIFGAADNATRYTMSQTMLMRSKNIDAVNNNISTALKTLESTDVALKQVSNLLQQMNDMASQALAAGSTPTISAVTTNTMTAATFVNGAMTNARLSITSDTGENFTFNIATATTGAGSSNNATWGQIANALNAANIGVEMIFETGFNSSPTASRVVLRSIDGKTGFSIDGSSTQALVDDLVGINSAYDGAYNSSRFASGATVPTYSASQPQGMRFGTGGAVTTASSVPNAITANSSISFVGADGVARTWNSTTATTVDAMIGQINAMNAGVKAELVTGGFLRLRNLTGTQMTVLNGTGTFDAAAAGGSRFNAVQGQPVVTGAAVLGSTNNDERLRLGQQFEAYKTEITNVVQRNVVQSGRNLLQGQSTSVILNEFSGNPINIAGQNVSIATLGLATLGSAWATNLNIETSLTEVQSAQARVLSYSGQFGTYSSFIKERYDINREFSTNMKTLGDDLVAADVADESAKLTALQTQQQFAVQAFSAGSANAQSLLRLLG